jgi:tetratricopeptide (TPR) repeat protein
MSTKRRSIPLQAFLCLLLVASVVVTFWPALNNGFVNFDDHDYVTENSWVLRGLTGDGLKWALTTNHAGNWHPLTWLSHMLDVELFGTNPRGHHFTSLLLHATNAALLFLVLRIMTGTLWRSFIVAALFALHPLRVESVAWVSERKDVLSGLFFMLTLFAYGRYATQRTKETKDQRLKTKDSGPAEAGTVGSALHAPRSVLYYWLALLFFALGLMSKPMLVTVPFVLLLIDVWPLRRLCWSQPSPGTLRQRFLEKAPFLLLALGASIATFFAQKEGGNVASLVSVPIGLRLENGLISYVTYLWQLLWPVRLSAYYPFPKDLPVWSVAGAALLLVVTTWLVFRSRKDFAITGWLWYLAMLAPVIGLIQVGMQGHADRYTYLPAIGVLVALVWSVDGLFGERKWVPLVACGAATGLLAFLTNQQVRVWKDSISLFTHTISTAGSSPVAHLNLGSALTGAGRLDEAQAHFEAALSLWPGYLEAASNLGFVLCLQGKLDEAVTQFHRVLELSPGIIKTRYLLANALSQLNRQGEAVSEYRRVLEADPSHAAALNDLSWLLATSSDQTVRNPQQAVSLAERAVNLTSSADPLFLGTLAGAYASAGRFDEAIREAKRAREKAEESGLVEVARRNSELLRLFQEGKAFREPPTPP